MIDNPREDPAGEPEDNPQSELEEPGERQMQQEMPKRAPGSESIQGNGDRGPAG